MKPVQSEAPPGPYDEMDAMAGNECQAGYDQLKKVCGSTVAEITVLLD